jgi:hypothetical protein
MDMAALKPYFSQNVLVVAGSKDFVGTLEGVPGSQQAVTMKPLSDAVANNYPFAINGVALLSVDAISFLQKLSA